MKGNVAGLSIYYLPMQTLKAKWMEPKENETFVGWRKWFANPYVFRLLFNEMNNDLVNGFQCFNDLGIRRVTLKDFSESIIGIKLMHTFEKMNDFKIFMVC